MSGILRRFANDRYKKSAPCENGMKIGRMGCIRCDRIAYNADIRFENKAKSKRKSGKKLQKIRKKTGIL